MACLKILFVVYLFCEIAFGFEDDEIPTLPTEFTRREAKALLKAHNDYRRKVVPSGSDIRLLTWSTDLADQAQAYVSKCIFAHDEAYSFGEFGTIGENLYLSIGKLESLEEISQVVTKWHGERSDYDYASNKCAVGKTCGHYTQVVWDSTYKVGCGITRCKGDVEVGLSSFSQPTMVACRYGPSGNVKPLFSYTPRRPYKKGPRCSDCPKEAPDCVDNLCYSKPEKFTAENETSTKPMPFPKAPETTTTLTSTSAQSLRCNFCQGDASAVACVKRKQSKLCGSEKPAGEQWPSSITGAWMCATYWNEGVVIKMDCLSESQCLQQFGDQESDEVQCCRTNLCNTGGGASTLCMSLILPVACAALNIYFASKPLFV